MINANYIAMKNFIDKKGEPIRIQTKYRLSQPASIGDTVLHLADIFGLLPDNTMVLGSESVVISLVNADKSVTISKPITQDHTDEEYLSIDIQGHGLPMARYQRITQDYLEYTRKVRISKFVIANYGSKVTFGGKEFFVVGVDDDQWSNGLKLREINSKITVYRSKLGDKNDFSYDEDLERKYTDVDGYCEYITSNMMLGATGYNPSTISYITVSDDYDIRFGDNLLIDTEVYKVTGMNRYRFKNLLFLIVDYENTKIIEGVEDGE